MLLPQKRQNPAPTHLPAAVINFSHLSQCQSDTDSQIPSLSLSPRCREPANIPVPPRNWPLPVTAS